MMSGAVAINIHTKNNYGGNIEYMRYGDVITHVHMHGT